MAVKVKRERPDQRRHHRVTAPLFVTIAGHSVRAADWSLGGLRIEEFPGELPGIGAEIPLSLSLPFQGFDVGFEAKAEVVRTNTSTSSFALRFTELGERERELMQHFIEELVRGSMSDVEDTIQRIDVPVTPASLEPDKPSIKQMPARRVPLKTLSMSAFYLVLGSAVFGYAAILGYSNFFRMEVPTAVINAPVETVVAQADGRVDWGRFKPGDHVKSGDVIIELIDNQLEREIELADLAVAERKAKLAFVKKRHVEELERIRGYATIEMKNVQQTRIELDALAQQLKFAEQQLGRLKSLNTKGYATDSKVEEAERQVIALKKDLDIRRVELASRVELADQNLGKRLFSGNETIGSADLTGKGAELEAEVRLAEHEVQLSQQRRIAWSNQKMRAAVRAPFDGTLLELPRIDQGSVRKGDVIAILEQRRNRHVMAYMNQDEVLKVGLGDEALIFMPALSESVKGRIAKIDRTSGFVREQDNRQNPGYTWRGATDRSAKVTIEFNEPTKVADADKYRSGLPVVVVFEQRSTNSLMGAIKKKFSTAL